MTTALPDARVSRTWARVLTGRRLTELERALQDPELVSLRFELARVDLELAVRERQHRDGETAANWRQVQAVAVKLEQKLKAAVGPEDLDLQELREITTEVLARCRKAADERDAWHEIQSLQEHRRRLADTERKYIEMREYKVPATDLVLMFDELHRAAETIILDHVTRLALFHEIQRRLDGARGAARVPVRLPLDDPRGDPSDAGLGARDLGPTGDVDAGDVPEGGGPDGDPPPPAPNPGGRGVDR